MSYVRFEDHVAGLALFFDDYRDNAPVRFTCDSRRWLRRRR